MALNLTQKLIHPHLVEGDPAPGREIALSVDQVLLQDVLGTLAMLEFEAMASIESASAWRRNTLIIISSRRTT
jgi:homoaconitase/3-isopropylmalate dehydratase large subunit